MRSLLSGFGIRAAETRRAPAASRTAIHCLHRCRSPLAHFSASASAPPSSASRSLPLFDYSAALQSVHRPASASAAAVLSSAVLPSPRARG